LALSAYALVAVFCVMAALPPRYVGIAALLMGVGYPLAASIYLLRRPHGTQAQA
jgi:hypothetical protein